MAGLRLMAVALVLAAVLVGCGAGAEPVAVPPAGVDELTVPTPSPAPRDFVDLIDNPWLGSGEEQVYDVVGGPATIRTVHRERTGLRIAGVGVTAVVSVDVDEVGRTLNQVTDWWAQDTRRNVWWLGRETRPGGGVVDPSLSWRAGDAGAQAGLVMPARPRRGDGFVGFMSPTAGTLLTSVADVTGAGDERAVLLDQTQPGQPGRTRRATYRWGVGLVSLTDAEGSAATLVPTTE